MDVTGHMEVGAPLRDPAEGARRDTAAEAAHDAEAGTWLIRLRSSAYAFALADGGSALRHLYWGTPGGREGAGIAVPDTDMAARYLKWTTEEADEYVPWTSARYDEPTLKAAGPDGT
jgi:hypothetical protein